MLAEEEDFSGTWKAGLEEQGSKYLLALLMDKISVRNDNKLSTLRPCATCSSQGRSKDCSSCAAARSGKVVTDWIRTERRVKVVMAGTNCLKRLNEFWQECCNLVETWSRRTWRRNQGVQSLKEARKAMEVVASVELTPSIGSMGMALAPELSGGRWVTRGRMRRGLRPILGVKELVILQSNQRLAELIMIEAHEKGHDGVDGTLARSRSRAWICGGG